MTTIAFDGRVMAADSYVSQSPKTLSVLKILPYKNLDTGDHFVMGAAGLMGEVAPLFRWRMHGGEHKTKGTSLLIAQFCPDMRIMYVDDVDEDGLYCERGMQCAIGSGADYAYGAMLAGCSAREAVEHAMSIDLYTGGHIVEFDVISFEWITPPLPGVLERLRRNIENV